MAGEVSAIATLRLVWLRHYYAPDEAGQVRWHPEADLPSAAQRCSSPYDPDAHQGGKRATAWLGHKVHLTGACDPGAPLLITDVRAVAATEMEAFREEYQPWPPPSPPRPARGE